MATSVSSVTSHFPDAENGFTTTTSGAVTAGATTVGLNSVAGYTNGEPVVMVIDPSNAKKQTFTGIIDTSGSQVTGVVWTAGTNVDHLAGATVIDTPTATHVAMISKGIKVEHNQDGTHKNTLVGMLAGTQTFTGAKTFSDITLNSGSVDPEDLVSGTGTTWAWQSWTPTYTNITAGNGTTTAKYMQIGKTVFGKIIFTLGSTSSVGTAPKFSLPVTSTTILNASQPLGSVSLIDATGSTYAGFIYHDSTTVVKFALFDTGLSYPILIDITATVPFTWTTSDIIVGEFSYEAA